LVATQGSAAIWLLGIGLLLSWAAAPGWTELTLMWPDRVGGIAATCAEAFRRYNPVLANLTGVCYWWGWVPTCGLTALLSSQALHDWYLPAVPVTAMAVGIVVAFAVLNLTGIARVSWVVKYIAAGAASLALLSAVLPLLHGDVDGSRATSWHLLSPFHGVFGGISSAMAGLYLIGFAAPAFEAATCHVGEMRDPARSLPRAMAASAVMAGLFFLVLPATWLGIFGSAGLGDASRAGLAHLLGPTFVPLFGGLAKSAAIWFLVLNMFHGTLQPLAGASRTLSQLSEDGLLPRLVGLRNRFDAPHVAIVLTAGMAIAFLLVGDPLWMIAAANFTYLISIALPSVAVWLLRRDDPDRERLWRAPKGTVTLGLFAAGAWLVATVLGFRQFGMPVVLSGLALAYSGSLFYLWRRFTDLRSERREGKGRSLHVKLTGAMLAVMVLDGAGYLLAVTSSGHSSPARIALLEDIFVAVALVSIGVGLVLPGMIAHSVTQVADAANELSLGTLTELTHAMEALGRGDLDQARATQQVTPVIVHSRDEVGAMAAAFNHMQDEISRAARALDGAREALSRSRGDLEYLATHDSLTTLPNRRHAKDEVERLIAECVVAGRRCAVVALDLDGFKYINDSRGHAVGDDVLTHVADLFRAQLRPSDFIGRVGGDEFAAVLPNISADEAQLVIFRLLEALRSEAIVVQNGRAVRVTASAGMAFLNPTEPQTAADLLVEADVAMYQAKDSGRDRLAIYSTGDLRQADLRGRHTWVDRIQDALEHDQFVLQAQPILNLHTGTVDRYEVLLRMIGLDGVLIPPGDFLPAAERSGLIGQIDQWVIVETCRMLAEQQHAGRDTHLSVNLSGTSMGEPTMLALIQRELANLPRRGGLTIEVTETAAITDIDRARSFADHLETLGCEFALDDFGAGYGSFYYLKHLPFDYLKIDGTFIRDLLTDRADQVLVRSLVHIARELGKHTVAEFVEDQATQDKLRELGVDYAQGYHVGRPAALNTHQGAFAAALTTRSAAS
ncbi:MAG TPA: EAL domain-containing protein, partial [Jatrophihabitantaceae bacterium]|nr:EAL domain-containing protein [Jatrophihabitantaceae bacterium]